jgi:hypothetical protein
MKMGVAKPEGSVSNRERDDSLKVMKQETAAQRFRSTVIQRQCFWLLAGISSYE